jgi:hypothetical protein
LALGIATILQIATANDVRAGEGNIEVVELGAESRYPDSIRFFVTARSPQVIDEIRLFIRSTGRYATGTYWTLEFEPAELVTGETVLPTGFGNRYIPPGTAIRYSFEIWDEAGAVHRTPDQEFVYFDARFDWQTITSGLITVDYYGEEGKGRAATVLNAAQEGLRHMAPVLGIDPTEPFRIVAYDSYLEMSAALPSDSQIQQGRVRTEGMAFGDERVVLVQSFDPAIWGIVSHEVTHLATAEAARRAYPRMPAWLKEGLAEYGNLAPTSGYDDALARGIHDGRIKPLSNLATFRGTPNEIVTAYGQGQSVVSYLAAEYGEGKIAELMQAFQSTFNIDQALQLVYGLNLLGLDNRWRTATGLEPWPLPDEPELALPKSPTATPRPSPTPTRTPRPPTPTPAPTPVPPTATPNPTPTGVAPTPTATPRAAPEGAGPAGESSPGCNAPISNGGVPGDLALLVILVAPFCVLAFRGLRSPFRRKRVNGRSTEPVIRRSEESEPR